MKHWSELLASYPRHAIALALAAGLALAASSPLLVFVLAALVAILMTAVGQRGHVVIAASALLIAGSALGADRLSAIDADPLAALGSSQVSLRGHLVNLPRNDERGSSLRMRVRGFGQLVQVRSQVAVDPSLSIGDEVIVSGRLRPVDPQRASSASARSYASYLLRSGVRRQLSTQEVVVSGARRGGASGLVDAIRRRAERALAFGLDGEPAALLRGMVLGGDAALPEATAEDFRIAGLSHILAVSGQNVLLLVVLVLAILTALGAPRRWRLIVPSLVIVIYVLLCGAQASVIRAGAMGLAGLAALAASRRSSRVYALILAAIVVLAWNPRALSDVGAQLSFAAVLGIMVFTGPIAMRLRWFPSWAAEAFAATAAATIATAPLMAFHFDAVSLVSLAANVLGEPLIAPIVWLGSLTAALGQVSMPLAALLGAPNGFLLGVLISLASAAASLPGAQLAWSGFNVVDLIAAYGLVLVAAALAHRQAALPRLPRASLAAAGLVLVALLVPIRRGAPSVAGPEIVMLDVGQGDATLLRGDGCNALIDAGPPAGGLGRSLRELGVRRLDALLITHPEDDHFGGALELARAEHLPIATFLDGGGNTPRADYAELRQLLARSGARAVAAVAGTRWRCPGITIEVIAPTPQAPGAPPPDHPNDRAAVTLVAVGELTMFASGDAESPQLLGLGLGPVDVLKVPHHGSADPGLAELLARTRPRVALIGVGASNRYGHPAPQALAALSAGGSEVLRTDRDGSIFLRGLPSGEIAIKLRVTRR